MVSTSVYSLTTRPRTCSGMVLFRSTSACAAASAAARRVVSADCAAGGAPRRAAPARAPAAPLFGLGKFFGLGSACFGAEAAATAAVVLGAGRW